MFTQDIIKAYRTLRRNNLNPGEFFIEKDKTVAEAYYDLIKEAKKKQPRGKYVIYCHKHIQEDITYVEDLFSQSDYKKMDAGQIKKLFTKHKNKLYCCYDNFIYRLCSLVAESDFDYRDFDIVYYDKDKAHHAIMSRDGYLSNWPIGYFTFGD